MDKIIFVYEKNIFEINVDKEKNLNDVLKNYSNIIGNNKNDLYFLYKGKKLSLSSEIKIEEFKRYNIIIFVNNIKIHNNSIIIKKEINDLLCPQCNNLACLNINNYKFCLSNCINNHINPYISVNEFINNEYIEDEKIKCKNCGNMRYLYGDFYINNLKSYICPLCCYLKEKVIDYNYKYNYCFEHYKQFVSYCSKCNNKNLCENCEEEHKKHKIILFKESKFNNTKKIN